MVMSVKEVLYEMLNHHFPLVIPVHQSQTRGKIKENEVLFLRLIIEYILFLLTQLESKYSIILLYPINA